MPLTAIAKALGLDENADEAKILEAVGNLKATPPEGETKTLEQQVSESGKVLLDADTLTSLTEKANAGEAAAKQLETMTLDAAYQRALDRVAIDSTPETKALYTALPVDQAVKLLDSLKPIANAKPKGQGGHDTETPDGVDPESFELNAAVEARMADKGENFSTALEHVMADHERKALEV